MPFAEHVIEQTTIAPHYETAVQQPINEASITYKYLLEYDDELFESTESVGPENRLSTPIGIIEAEIDEYKKMLKPSEDCDIIKWWKDNEEMLPLLTKLARLILAIPASSAAAESNFSSAGFVVSDRRSQIDSSLLQSILVCRNNMDLLLN